MQANESMLEPGEYWNILARRKLQFVLPFAVVLAIAAALAMFLPPVFRSEATILVQRQTIPQDLVATTVTGYVQEQIQQIRQRITTHDNLLQIADFFALYPEDFVRDPSEAVLKVRENIEVKMVDVQASDPDQQGTRLATIAFNVAYNSDDPETAQAVTADLADRFLETYRKSRNQAAAQVNVFLGDEAEAIKQEIAELEVQLAGFKQEERHQLPELMGMNLQLFERTEQQIQDTEERIRGLLQSIDTIRAELSLTEPYEDVFTEEGQRIMTASERLSMLTAEYLRTSARYSAEHPDVVRLTREIRILAEQTGDSARADELMTQLITLQEQLRQARQQYSSGHPEVTRLESAIAAVQRGMQTSLISTEGRNTAMATAPDNPRYVALKTQLEATETNLAAERKKLADLNEKLQEYEERLFQTPIVERDYKSLSRGYEDALRKFSELTQKQLQAEVAQTLESGQGAEQWQLVSQAFLPTLPESPNRIGIMLLGMLLAFAAGIGAVTVAEYLDKTVRSARRLTAAIGAPPLVLIPRIQASGKSR